MNFLGHQLLSYPDSALMAGNFLGDFIKGHNWQNVEKEVARGILMHREIDRFTDQQQTTHRIAEALRPACGKYASVISDIIIDHVLATCWKEYSNLTLADFAEKVYQNLDDYQYLMNEKAMFTFTWMRKHNWLLSYATIAGLKISLEGMSKRTGSVYNFTESIPIIQHNQSFFYMEAQQFLQTIIANKNQLLARVQIT